MSYKHPLLLVTLVIFLVNFLHSTKINQKIFVDVESINFVDAQKNGFLLILHENFVKNFLQDILLPTVYVTVQRLSQKNSLNTQEPERTVKILYPESLQVNCRLQIKLILWCFLQILNQGRKNDTDQRVVTQKLVPGVRGIREHEPAQWNHGGVVQDVSHAG